MEDIGHIRCICQGKGIFLLLPGTNTLDAGALIAENSRDGDGGSLHNRFLLEPGQKTHGIPPAFF